MVTPVMSNVEEIVYKWLTKRGIPFSFQSSLRGGYFSLGGAVVDFLIEDRRIAIRVHGEYWHRGVEKEGSDIIQKEMLREEGWTVVDLKSSDLEDPRRREQALNLALEGREML